MIYIEEKKVRNYFDEYGEDCKIIKKNINELKSAFQKFVSNTEYTGEEAESAKAYIKNVEKKILNDIWLAVKELRFMQTSLLTDFDSQVDNSKSTVIYDDKLDVIKRDFEDFDTDFNTFSKNVSSIYDILEEKFALITTFKEPNASKIKNGFTDLLIASSQFTGGISEGIISGVKKDFNSFEYEHKSDIKGSNFEQLCDAIESNIETCDAVLCKETDSVLSIYKSINNVKLKNNKRSIKALVTDINEEGEIEFDVNYINQVFNGGYDKMSPIEQKEFRDSFKEIVGEPIVNSNMNDKEALSAIEVWWKELISGVSDPITIGSTGVDGTYAGLEIFLKHAKKIAKFREFTNTKGTIMVAISDSNYYKGGRGGLRSISKAKLLSRTDAVGKAYRVNNALKTTSKVLIGIGGAVSFYEEYKAGEGLKTSERITNATVEAAWSVGSTVAIGAAVGSIVPGAGTVAGAAAGFVVGTVASVVANTVVHVKWFENGEKSVMDYVKSCANKSVDYVASQGKKIMNEISDNCNSVGNAIAKWCSFA